MYGERQEKAFNLSSNENVSVSHKSLARQGDTEIAIHLTAVWGRGNLPCLIILSKM